MGCWKTRPFLSPALDSVSIWNEHHANVEITMNPRTGLTPRASFPLEAGSSLVGGSWDDRFMGPLASAALYGCLLNWWMLVGFAAGFQPTTGLDMMIERD